MKAPVRFETQRLELRQPQDGDAPSIFERYASDPEVTRFLSWSWHRSLAETETFLRSSAEEWDRWPAGAYLIHSRHDGRLLGGTGIHYEAPDQATTGYVFARDAWGKGYATEALRAVVEMAGRIGVARLRALCHPEHRASWRVLEKCGFTRNPSWTRQVVFPNLAPGVPQDVLCYVRAPERAAMRRD